MKKFFAPPVFLMSLCLVISGGCGIDPINVPDADRSDSAPAGDMGTDASAPDPTESGSADEATTDADTSSDNAGDSGDVGTDADGGEDLAPEDAPQIRPRRVFHAASRTLMVGVENAVAASNVTVRDAETQTLLTQSDVAVTGAFTAQLEITMPDAVRLEAVSESGAVGSEEVELCDGGVNVYEFDAVIAQAWSDGALAANRSGNLIELTTEAEVLPRGLKVVVGNLDNEHGSAAPVDQDGSIELTISAESGDNLAIFAVEGNCNGGGEPLIIEAP